MAHVDLVASDGPSPIDNDKYLLKINKILK